MTLHDIQEWAEKAKISIGDHACSPSPSLKQLELFLAEAMTAQGRVTPRAEQDKPSVLKAQLNPHDYQWSEAGKIYRLEDLSREDLLQVACNCIEALEQADDLRLQMGRLMSDWRQGVVSGPDACEDA